METPCITCGNANLDSKQVQVAGDVRGETYTVEMRGLECPSCGYSTIEGVDMAEFQRLLADKYRENHGLLSSKQIRARREDMMHMTQQEFAEFLGVGIASIKRWEMSRIQDKRNNDLIIHRTTFAYDKTTASGFILANSTKLNFIHHSAITNTSFVDTTRVTRHCANVFKQYVKTLLEKSAKEFGQYKEGVEDAVLLSPILSDQSTNIDVPWPLLSNQKDSRARKN